MRVEVRPGEGGREAEDFADEIFAALCSASRRAGHEPQGVCRSDRLRAFVTDGPESLRDLAGTHRVQRIPSGSAARHTSTATVAVLDPVLTEV